MEYEIRSMQESDLDQVMLIEQVAFPTPWSKQSYEGELINQFATYYVIDIEGEIAGYGGIWCVFEEAHITNVAVAPAHRRQGLGRVLMEALLERARIKEASRVYLEVRPSNLAAINLYRGFGFLPGGVRRGYYTDNQEDALLLIKTLLPEYPAGGVLLDPERKD
ncbi:MAG: ribosomal protein S18-alanine N-acetyltransferase [Methanomassiliicoccales archaeon]